MTVAYLEGPAAWLKHGNSRNTLLIMLELVDGYESECARLEHSAMFTALHATGSAPVGEVLTLNSSSATLRVLALPSHTLLASCAIDAASSAGGVRRLELQPAGEVQADIRSHASMDQPHASSASVVTQSVRFAPRTPEEARALRDSSAPELQWINNTATSLLFTATPTTASVVAASHKAFTGLHALAWRLKKGVTTLLHSKKTHRLLLLALGFALGPPLLHRSNRGASADPSLPPSSSSAVERERQRQQSMRARL